MKKLTLKIAILLAGAAVLVPTMASAAEPTTGQKPGEADRSGKVQLKYLLHLPKDYDQKDSWPLLLFLHGIGERGDNLDLVKMHGPPKLIAAGKEFPFIVVSPQCPSDRWWKSDDLSALLDEIVEKYKVDRDRICVTGLSMGGFGTWSLVAFSPDRFAAFVPICGGGDPKTAARLAHVPIWVFHGAKDPVVPVKRSEEMVAALKEAGGNVKFTVYPEAGHDSWTEAYNNPELYDWLFQQKRAAK